VDGVVCATYLFIFLPSEQFQQSNWMPLAAIFVAAVSAVSVVVNTRRVLKSHETTSAPTRS
jgi:hypothetical protein